MKYINLTQGKRTIVDDDNYEELHKYKWLCDTGYAVTKGYPGVPKMKMHRLVNKTPEGFDTDHINRNRLDNRRCNLRTVTHQQNLYNNRLRPRNKSGHRGICFRPSPYNKWQVKLGCLYIGIFESLEEAVNIRRNLEEQMELVIY
jgi:hypothetical protein